MYDSLEGDDLKSKRQSKILEIIESHCIETQEELAEFLRKEGFRTTQATISRDIRELNLIKVSYNEAGRQKYSIADEGEKIPERLLSVFKDGIISVNYAGNIVVIKTFSGMGMVVATALDAMDNSDVLGTIAGDDTIFAVLKSEYDAVKVIEKFKNVISGKAKEYKSL
jgi:transcriptional regulator of arginine metabolism